MKGKAHSSYWRIMLMMFAAFLLVITVACGGGDDNADGAKKGDESTPSETNGGDATDPGDEQEQVTLKFATWLIYPDQAPFWEIGKAFEEKFPWITVDWIHVGGGQAMIDALTNSLAANDPIDVFWQNSFTQMVEFAENLTPFIESDPEFQAFGINPNLLEPFQVDGQQYALSRGNDTFIIYYNKDLLEQFGLEAPANDWTWEEMREMAIAATNPQEGYYGLGNSLGLWWNFGAMTIPNANGNAPRNNMMNDDLTVSLGDDPAVMEDIEWVQNWITRDGILLNQARMQEANITEDLWVAGKALFHLHVSPIIAIYNDQLNFNWDIAPLPAGTAKQVGMSFNNPMFMSKASRHKEAAWEFMKFWAATVEGQKLLIDAGGTLPSNDDPEILNHFANADVYAGLNTDALAYAASVGEIDPTIVMVGGNDMNDFLGQSGHAILQEEQSVYDFLPAAVEVLNNKLEQAREAFYGE